LIENKSLSTCIVIPARLGSKRFPKKVMWNFLGIPMIEHVYKRASLVISSQDIIVTSGDSQILEHMQSKGARVIKNLIDHKNGTSRAMEAIEGLNYQNFIVLQADEILVDPDHINKLMHSIQLKSGYKTWNLVTKLESVTELNNPNVVKCVTNAENEILKMFRENTSPLKEFKSMKKIMGIFAFNKDFMAYDKELEHSIFRLENSIEQQKILDTGTSIYAVDVDYSYPSVNLFEDIQIVRDFLATSDRQKNILRRYVE
jgi:3-deoxy-manno-octulosonate cytidylyltransferase (CMP-KDO synthetase)